MADVRDERVRAIPWLGRMLARPELGAAAGTVLVFIFFAAVAGGSGLFSAKGIVNFLEVSAQLGILAAPVALFPRLFGWDPGITERIVSEMLADGSLEAVRVMGGPGLTARAKPPAEGEIWVTERS